MTSLTSETSRGLDHFVGVVRRWWLLLIIGPVIAVAFGSAVASGYSVHYAADAQVLLNQPAQTLAPGDDTALHRLAQLQDTVAQLASSDAVLDAVRKSGATSRALDDLRSRVSASSIPNSLLLTIHTDFPTSSEAQRVASAVIDALSPRLSVFGSTSPATALTLETVHAPVVTKVSGSVARTILLSLVIGFGFSVLAAFALDRG